MNVCKEYVIRMQRVKIPLEDLLVYASQDIQEMEHTVTVSKILLKKNNFFKIYCSSLPSRLHSVASLEYSKGGVTGGKIHCKVRSLMENFIFCTVRNLDYQPHYQPQLLNSLYLKWSFPLRISSVNVNRSSSEYFFSKYEQICR